MLISEIREVDAHKRIKEYVNGESFIYLGRNYSLQLVLDPTVKAPVAKLSKGKFYVTVPTKDPTTVRKTLESWYKLKAKERITDRVKYYQHLFNVKPKRIVIKDQQKRWGSCTKDQQLIITAKTMITLDIILPSC